MEAEEEFRQGIHGCRTFDTHVFLAEILLQLPYVKAFSELVFIIDEQQKRQIVFLLEFLMSCLVVRADSDDMGVERSTFLIDKEGRLVKEWRKVKVKDHVAEALQAVKEIAEA